MNKKYKEYLEDNVIDEDNAVDIIDGQQEEIERLHSIIKEVRECVETAISEDYYDGEIYKIKKILDKENN